jgi:phosphoglycolate phosphatase-like HAD superfamily hydrolase
MKPKIIIYDFDGVVCDSVNVKTNAFVELYKDYSSDIQNQVRLYHLMNGGISRFEKIRYFQEELLNVPANEEDINRMASHFALLVKEKVIQSEYITGVLEFLEINHKKALQFICTGTPEFEIVEIIERRQIGHLFSGIFGSPKTKETIIKEIINITGVESSECVFFGDAMTDFNASLNCKVPFIGINNADTVFPDGTFIIDDFNDTKLNNLEL